MLKKPESLLSLSVIVFLSLIIAYVLFNVLESSGTIENDNLKFGGAAAGFFVSAVLLQRWWSQGIAEERTALEEEKKKLEKDREVLKEKLNKLRIPDFKVPPSFEPYIDQEHFMLFSYPKDWKRQPLMLQIQAIFSENPLSLRPGDDFQGTFNVVVSSTGQQTFTLKEIRMLADRMDIPLETVKREFGVDISSKTESLQVPLERVLSLMGVKGNTRREMVYDLLFAALEAMPGDVLRKDIEIIDGKESLIVERKWDVEDLGSLIQLSLITYIPETDLIFTFTFTDNLEDREKINLIQKQVIDTVKFWNLPTEKEISTINQS